LRLKISAYSLASTAFTLTCNPNKLAAVGSKNSFFSSTLDLNRVAFILPTMSVFLSNYSIKLISDHL